jgi:uncharacterized membrane protein
VNFLPARPARLLWIDAARGLALWAMFVFHLTWDLGHFRWIDQAIIYSKGFQWLGHVIASSFLLLVGVSLVLSRRGRGNLLRSHAFWRRWAIIAAAACAISAVSYLSFPETPIFFGILHLIALASLIAAPLVDAPLWLVLALGALALVAPEFLAGPFFDARIFWWTGLGTFEPPSNDYQPLFPWLGVVLLGVATGKLPFFARGESRSGTPRANALAFFGRHSLFFYLVHQPLFYGAFALLALFVVSPGQENLFLGQCVDQCVREAAQPDLCQETCGCVVWRAKKAGYWPRLAGDALTAAEKAQTHDDIVACFGDARPP